ncbi:MAG: YdeI/OmpD-associated family protein [Planctomycetes bacterium]|nr:YdeI/OmpD-associated family protein [Planctomycetota bacterium]
MKKLSKRQSFEGRADWRAWLAANHTTAQEIWLVIRKKHMAKAGLTYGEALEEALCFGWIDGILRRIDDKKHTVRFTPRRKNSIWSELNKKRVAQLIQEGRMTETGLAKIKEAQANGQWEKATVREDVTTVPAELTAALAGNARARESFEKLAPSYRKQFLHWISTAKRDQTREKRIKTTIKLLAANRRLGLESPYKD